MKGLFCLTIYIAASYCLNGQQTTINIKKNKGDIVNKKIIYNTTKPHSPDAILNVDKYINRKKDILLKLGSNYFTIEPYSLKRAFNPFTNGGIFDPDFKDVVRIKLDGSKLKVSCTLYSFDGKYIAKLVDNKLYPSKYYQEYVSDSSIEIFDDYNIPVFQILLSKKDNAIHVAGAFNADKTYVIISDLVGILKAPFYKSKLLMRQSERDSAFYKFLIDARKSLKPINE